MGIQGKGPKSTYLVPIWVLTGYLKRYLCGTKKSTNADINTYGAPNPLWGSPRSVGCQCNFLIDEVTFGAGDFEGGGAVVCSDFAEHAMHVVFHRLDREIQERRNLLVGHAASNHQK
jgi:hypothetical protein